MDTGHHGGVPLPLLIIMWVLQVGAEAFHALGGTLQNHIPPLIMDAFQMTSWTVVITVTILTYFKKRKRKEEA
jgi:hypothetical protein